MKILIISELYPPYYVGGYELNCKDTVDALINRGHQVTVLTSLWGVPKAVIRGNIHRILDFDNTYLGDGVKRNSKTLSRFAKRLLAFRRRFISRANYIITSNVISEIQPDVVYLWRLEMTTISPALCAQDRGLPTIFRIEDYWLARIRLTLNEKLPLVRNLYRSLTSGKRQMERLRLDNLLVISQALKDFYTNIGFTEPSMKVLPDGLPSHFLRDPDRYSYAPFSSKDGIVRLAFIGRVDPEKGPDIAIEAVAKLRENSYPLVCLDVIGTGNQAYLEYLKRLAYRRGVGDKVFFLGKLDQDDIFNRLHSYDALLFPSRWQEPFGRAIIEAMAQGLPVIAAQTGGVPEIVTGLENGLLVPADDPEGMADAINKLLRDPALAMKLSRNAFETIETRYNITQLTIQLEKHISETLSERRNLLMERGRALA